MKNNFLFAIFFIVFLSAQSIVIAAPADVDDVNQQIANDEGYGKDDAEYYSSENDNETIVEEEAPTTADDEAEKDEDLTDVNEEVGLDGDMPDDAGAK